MAPTSRQPENDRANRTLYLTGFNSKLIKRHLLRELFCQGGPVVDVTLFETHAYILFQHPESVPYCLALFDGIEMFGDKLRLKPRNFTAGNPYLYLDLLTRVRAKCRDEYLKIKPPNLPPKAYANDPIKEKKRRRNGGKKSSIDKGSDSIDKDHARPDETEGQNQAHSLKDIPPPSVPPKQQSMNVTKSSGSTSNSRRRKRGGKRNLPRIKKIQKKYKYLV